MTAILDMKSKKKKEYDKIQLLYRQTMSIRRRKLSMQFNNAFVKSDVIQLHQRPNTVVRRHLHAGSKDQKQNIFRTVP